MMTLNILIIFCMGNFLSLLQEFYKKQFIERLPLLDAIINAFLLIVNIYYFHCFSESKFTGIADFLVAAIIFNLLTLCIFLLFKFQAQSELKSEGSILYKIYFFTRIFFITFGLTSQFIYFGVFNFLSNFENSVNLDEEIKINFTDSIDLLLPVIDYLQVINFFLSIISILFITHQFYWQSFLDESWCSNNKFNKDKIVKALIEKDKALIKDTD